ncbi:hypothetical protein HPB52_025445 [Rhipicephalus sanguineus]|uniref:Uncharacterized protein n=1 Tax=Rhipicephalus sanguineus TaxID=34632 RepID=A0A9D4TD17_RHISA|nr:hypothetical protein HPB52_025445 [Rhipicephalus sanguineus]
MNKVREANETLRQGNSALRKTINNLSREIAETQSPQRPTPSSSEIEETSTKNQEAAVEKQALKKRAIEATPKQKENDCNDNLEARFEARFIKLEEIITANIAAVTAMKQTVDTCQAENINRFAYIERTLQPIVSHLTFAPLIALHPPNQGTLYAGKTRKREYEKIRIITKSGNVTPEVGKIRILGMVIEKHGRNGEIIARLTAKAANATRPRDSSNGSRPRKQA